MEYGDNTPVTQDDFLVFREYRLHMSVDELATEYTLGGQFFNDNERSLQTKLSDLHKQYDNSPLAEHPPTGHQRCDIQVRLSDGDIANLPGGLPHARG